MDRRKRRVRDTKEAVELKEKGNAALKKGCYKTAAKYYTDALELRKDLLAVYTNRALARLKIEDYQGVIDDATRILEYCEVFHDGFTRERDLCYKAFMRRAQAFRGQKDYELALKDLESAGVLFPEDKDVLRFIKLTQEDMEMAQRLASIMQNSATLEGKEYLDFLLDFLSGKTDGEEHKEKKACYHGLTVEQVQKVGEILNSNDLVHYFNAKGGFKCLVEALEYDTAHVKIIQRVLEKDKKLQESVQSQKLYEFLIDFLFKNNSNVEGKLLEPAVVHCILEILEDASLNEFVRESLSEKKKIKDLFLVVLKSISIQENKKLVSSLIQFASNLCYGSMKFKTMLKTEKLSDFLGMLK